MADDIDGVGKVSFTPRNLEREWTYQHTTEDSGRGEGEGGTAYHGYGGPGGGSRPPYGRSRPERAAFDTAAAISVFPENILTEEARRTLHALIDEIERLRYDLDIAHKREAYLEELADQHPTLPILNRRAFMRELNRVSGLAGRSELAAVVLHLYLETYADIRQERSLTAAEAALSHLAQMVKANIRASDVAGHIGGAGIGVILTQATPDDASYVARELVDLLARRPFAWNREVLAMSVSVGTASVDPTVPPEAVLEAAERDQHRRMVSMGG